MNLRRLAEDYLRRAEVRVESAKNAMRTQDFPDTVRFSQEAVELSLKACLRASGVEYAKEHDVGEVLKNVSGRFPAWFREEVDRLAEVSADLAGKRAAAMYGLEVEGKTAGEIFEKQDAQDALRDSRDVLKKVKRLMTD